MADHKDLTEHFIAGELVFDGALLKVRRDRVRLPDGSEGAREYIRHPGAVAVVALFDPIRERYEELRSDPAELERLLGVGAEKASVVAAVSTGWAAAGNWPARSTSFAPAHTSTS